MVSFFAQIGELKDELAALQEKYKFMCERMNTASQRLYQTNMQRMMSEEEISRSCKWLLVKNNKRSWLMY